MQNELDVDVTTRRFKAREWARANGELPRIEPPDPGGSTYPPPISGWRKYFRWENLTVAGREVKGWVVPQQLGIALIVLILGVIGWAYKSNTSDQRETRDAIIEMKTMLNERTQTFKEQQAEFKEQLDTERRIAELQREQQRNETHELKAALRQSGIRIKESN